jgi:hypothetical protein
MLQAQKGKIIRVVVSSIAVDVGNLPRFHREISIQTIAEAATTSASKKNAFFRLLRQGPATCHRES